VCQRTDKLAQVASTDGFLEVTTMPSTEWSAKRKRQYQHIKYSVLAPKA
jgi:hypothetical protein